VITRPDHHLLLDAYHTADLLHLLGFLDEVLRHGGHDMREDIADRYTPTTLRHLLDELDTHASVLRRALNTAKGTSPS
jgi:hypothetical protein